MVRRLQFDYFSRHSALWPSSLLKARQTPGPEKPARLANRRDRSTTYRCPGKPDQSYALYLPSNYSADEKWPIVYAFDPAARGASPWSDEGRRRTLRLSAGRSNNSRNGSWKIEAEAAEAIVEDTHARLSIDDRRVYFAGFSGGARVAHRLRKSANAPPGCS